MTLLTKFGTEEGAVVNGNRNATRFEYVTDVAATNDIMYIIDGTQIRTFDFKKSNLFLDLQNLELFSR